MSDHKTLSIQLSAPKTNPFGEKYFQEVNNLTFANQASETVFARDYQQEFSKEETLYLVAGTDSGLLYKYVQKLGVPKGSIVIFIDLQAVNEQADLVPAGGEVWQGNLRVVNQDFDLNRLLDDEFNSFVIRKKISVIKSFAVNDAQIGSVYHDFWKALEIEVHAFFRTNFSAQSTKQFEVARLRNAPDNLVPVSKIVGSLQGKDALIIGGGPTLDAAVDWIRDNQDSLVIFAASRIAKRMEQEGIIPDFFVTVDPKHVSYLISKEMFNFSDSSILLNNFHAAPNLINQWNGLSLYTGQRYGWHDETAAPNVEGPGPTVTNTALHLAFMLGAENIYLTGIDFCFAGGQTHESSSDEAKLQDIFKYKNLSKVLDNSGAYTETSDDYYAGMKTMEQAIAAYLAHRPAKFYSLGLHSAKMENVEYLPFEQVVFNEQDKTSWLLDLRESLAADFSRENRLAFAEQTGKDFDKQLKRFKEMNKLAKEGLSYADKLYDPKTQDLRPKAGSNVTKIRRKLDNLIGLDGDFVVNYQAEFFADTFKEVENEQNMSPAEVVEQLKSYFSGVQKFCDDFLVQLEFARKRVKLRVNELTGKMLPCEFFSEWQHSTEHQWHTQFGRSLQWQTWHPEIELDAENQACLDEAKEEFAKFISTEKTESFEWKKKQVTNVATLFTRANYAFESKNNDELAKIVEFVENMDAKDPAQKQNFLLYLAAMLADLNQDQTQAIELYGQIDIAFFKHHALKRQLNIKMAQNDYDGALADLEQLCSFSLDYMVHYADLLNLLGQKPMAVDVLKLFIENKYTAAATLKLVQWLIELDAKADAMLYLDAMLEREPDNNPAQLLRQKLQAES